MKNGVITRRDAVTLSIAEALKQKRVDQWFGPADQLMIFKKIIDEIVRKQLKMPFDAGAYRLDGIPLELELERLTAWIATDEGPNAPWVYTPKATPEQWEANYRMKRRNRQRAQAAEHIPLDIKRWLEDNGYTCLEDAV